MDRVHRVPRLWSNAELRKFAHLFGGRVVNVSAWNDGDKQGGKYRDYFSKADSYSLTNYDDDKRGFQGVEGEIFLDLTAPFPDELRGRFDVVFNHTTLEHIYEVERAFGNLCALTRDVVILVVPFVQSMHSSYGDFWRFSPQAVARMFEDKGFHIGYLSFNSHKRASIYVFCIALRDKGRWAGQLPFEFSLIDKRHSALPRAICRRWCLSACVGPSGSPAVAFAEMTDP